MKREILFRGKVFLKEEWVYGDLVKTENLCAIKKAEGDYFRPTQVFPNTVGQYTGLKDCNDKGIYEGDIVTIGNNLKAIVIWFNGSFRFQDELSSKATYLDDIGVIMRDYDVQVIGNIHDNPELMK